MTDSDTENRPPPFEAVFSGDDVEQRIYGTILQTREPSTGGAIAEVVGCDPKTARKYLNWFAELGVVTHHDGHPSTYERNDAYFEWRHINQLASEHSLEELKQRVRELTETISTYERRYDAPTPAAVDAVAEADNMTIDEVYSDLGDWETARQERRRYEQARQQRTGATDHERISG